MVINKVDGRLVTELHQRPLQLARQIKAKVKELDQKLLQAMVKTIRKQLRSMWRNDLYSVC